MNDALHPIVTDSPSTQPSTSSLPSPTDEDQFAAFLEEEHATQASPAARSAAPTQAPTQAAPIAPSKPLIKFGPEGQRKQHTWKRQTLKLGTGACRVRSFRGKYSDQGLEHLDDAINEWLDANPDVEVKFVTSTADMFEGKTREPALVLNLWY